MRREVSWMGLEPLEVIERACFFLYFLSCEDTMERQLVEIQKEALARYLICWKVDFGFLSL
jgi:hypothetical protein